MQDIDTRTGYVRNNRRHSTDSGKGVRMRSKTFKKRLVNSVGVFKIRGSWQGIETETKVSCQTSKTKASVKSLTPSVKKSKMSIKSGLTRHNSSAMVQSQVIPYIEQTSDISHKEQSKNTPRKEQTKDPSCIEQIKNKSGTEQSKNTLQSWDTPQEVKSKTKPKTAQSKTTSNKVQSQIDSRKTHSKTNPHKIQSNTNSQRAESKTNSQKVRSQTTPHKEHSRSVKKKKEEIDKKLNQMAREHMIALSSSSKNSATHDGVSVPNDCEDSIESDDASFEKITPYCNIVECRPVEGESYLEISHEDDKTSPFTQQQQDGAPSTTQKAKSSKLKRFRKSVRRLFARRSQNA